MKKVLMAKKHIQMEGSNFLITVALVPKLNIVGLLVALIAIHNWHLIQLSMTNVFFHGPL